MILLLLLSLAAAAAPPAQTAPDPRPDIPTGASGDLGPPADPGDEPRVASDASGVAAYCAHFAGRLGDKVVRSVASRNRQYGLVWRADLAATDSPEDQSRFLCWGTKQKDGSIGYSVLVMPLEMFDPSQNIRPLAPDDPARMTTPPH